MPFKLRDKGLHLVDMTAIVAGTQIHEPFETRMRRRLIDEAGHSAFAILVIDEIQSIVGAGDAEGSMNAAKYTQTRPVRGEHSGYQRTTTLAVSQIHRKGCGARTGSSL